MLFFDLTLVVASLRTPRVHPCDHGLFHLTAGASLATVSRVSRVASEYEYRYELAEGREKMKMGKRR